ncbi:MAG: Rrf2 family transcriptional regulator [Aldersonia sp.]|nr:Rrf2 family transcriptional regulator [Aldersonia sp.]
MHISARGDCAVRALTELAGTPDQPMKAEVLATAQHLSPKLLEAVLTDLRNGGLVCSRRGPDGGYWLARPAAEISIADVIRIVEGPLASVRGERPEDVTYDGSAAPLQRVWIAVRVSMRSVLEQVSIADVATDRLPEFVGEMTADPQAWRRRETP